MLKPVQVDVGRICFYILSFENTIAEQKIATCISHLLFHSLLESFVQSTLLAF